MKRYLLTPNDIIVATDYERLTQGFLDKLREKLKRAHPDYSDIIDSNLNNAQLRFDLTEIKHIEYDEENGFKIKSLKGEGWTKNPNGQIDYAKFIVYKNK